MSHKKYPITKTDHEWEENLSELEFHVLRNKGTEAPYSGIYTDFNEKGYYFCKGCNEKLFATENKFFSSCGWPSFDAETDSAKIEKITDNTLGMIRTEIVCSKCGSHLGHIFDDGPTKKGMRYCVNSVSLKFGK